MGSMVYHEGDERCVLDSMPPHSTLIGRQHKRRTSVGTRRRNISMSSFQDYLKLIFSVSGRQARLDLDSCNENPDYILGRNGAAHEASRVRLAWSSRTSRERTTKTVANTCYTQSAVSSICKR